MLTTVMKQGVGETLRGTLNSTIDKRFPAKNAEKAAMIDAHNQAVLEKGRTEMEGIPGGWPAHVEYEHDAAAPAHHITTAGAAPATASAAQAQPTTTSVNQQEPPRNVSPRDGSDKSRSLGKLFKRKAVAAGEQGMETR